MEEAPFDWEGRYREGTARWDFGEAVPGLVDWLRDAEPLAGKVLVPGCGHGHEAAVVAKAWSESEVIGLDISETAIVGAKDQYGDMDNVSFAVGDYFAPGGDEDCVAIIEHTCFCAIPPSLRPAYAETSARRLGEGGLLIAVFYLHPEETEDDPDDGPPWGCSVPELNALFDPYFGTELSCVPERSFEGRKYRELLRVLRK